MMSEQNSDFNRIEQNNRDISGFQFESLIFNLKMFPSCDDTGDVSTEGGFQLDSRTEICKE